MPGYLKIYNTTNCSLENLRDKLRNSFVLYNDTLYLLTTFHTIDIQTVTDNGLLCSSNYTNRYCQYVPLFFDLEHN